ncbi:hypothetical protein IJJ46_02320 [Candidatus Saccharibacteria bacterium]|nr:hypothetical protein [Candidatus Saccharibacteria bacterium]
MNKINVLLTTANGNLSDKKAMIEKAVKTAEEYAFSKLKINWDVDILVTNRIPMIIPENGAGGYTFSADFIRINIDDEKATKSLITENIIHELCHAARWGKNDEWTNSLFDGLIFEGLASYFEAEFVRESNEKTLFIKTILERTDEKNEKILKRLHEQLDSNRYDYDTIFFNGNDDLPRWAGYSLGYYLVKKYLKKTGKKIEDAFADKYADFRSVL